MNRAQKALFNKSNVFQQILWNPIAWWGKWGRGGRRQTRDKETKKERQRKKKETREGEVKEKQKEMYETRFLKEGDQ